MLPPDGMLRILPDQIRIPDVAFLRWEKFPHRQLPREPVPEVSPDLAVEVLSESNTDRETNRKLQEYFRSGTRLVWYVDPQTETARVYTSPDACIAVERDGVLDGEEILPGFRLSLKELFQRAQGRQV